MKSKTRNIPTNVIVPLSIILFILVLYSANFLGCCLLNGNYLSDIDYIRIALSANKNTASYHNNSHSLPHYSNSRILPDYSPGCCNVDRWPVWIGHNPLNARLLGFYQVVVDIKVDARDDISHTNYTTQYYYVITSCGHISDVYSNTTANSM